MPEIFKELSLYIIGFILPVGLGLKGFRLSNLGLSFVNKIAQIKFHKKKLVLVLFIALTIGLNIWLKITGSNAPLFNQFPYSLPIILLTLILFLWRIELIIIAFISIVLSQYWVVSISSLLGYESTSYHIALKFILGLELGYSIIYLRQLIEQYKTGKNIFDIIKLPLLFLIVISLITLASALFIQDIELKHAGIILITGITIVFAVNHIVPAFIFNLITRQKGKFRTEPLTLKSTIVSALTLVLFVFNSLTLSAFVPVIFTLPVSIKLKKRIVHYLLRRSCQFIMWANFLFQFKHVNKHKMDFSKPSVIVANHQSHLDLVLILSLNPKMIAVTNKWVWNNFFYGIIVRYLGYYPVYNGAKADFNKVKEKVKDGYSILIFPEGSRTKDGKIKRYHQGAFKIAQDLNLDIQPVLIHGAYQCLPKTEFFLRPGNITLKYFDRIKVTPVNIEKNETYRHQAKALTKLMRKEFNDLAFEEENTNFYKTNIINNYIYKGRNLENEIKKQLRLNNNFETINRLIPTSGRIVEIGCGFGCLSFMLKLISKERQLFGIDSDEGIINIAKQAIKDRTDIDFKAGAFTDEHIPIADAYILNVAEILKTENNTIEVLEKCLQKLNSNGKVFVQLAGEDALELSEDSILETAKIKGMNCRQIENSKNSMAKMFLLENGK